METCDIRCKNFSQKMNYPKQGEYSGFCAAKNGAIIYTRDIKAYDRYGSATQYPCITPEARDLEEWSVEQFDPFGWITEEAYEETSKPITEY